MKTSKKLSLNTTSVRQLGEADFDTVAGGMESYAACGGSPTNRPCYTVNPASGCPVTSAQPCPTTGSAQCPPTLGPACLYK